ncbi:MAG TPA: hypothetical protein VFQ54_00550, partial [Thermomicrobiales bacterium]|nr:hypothetical protein [Thermomicrobiales bacterium]
NLPTQLIAAFRATLEEINEATVLVHVVDITHPTAGEQVATVKETLEDLGVDGQPVVYALNKIEALSEEQLADLPNLMARIGLPADSVAISARDGLHIDTLFARIEGILETEDHFVPVTATIPYNQSELVERFHVLGRVEEREFDDVGTTLTGWLPERDLGRFGSLIQRRTVSVPPAQVEDEIPVWETLPAEVQAAHPAA